MQEQRIKCKVDKQKACNKELTNSLGMQEQRIKMQGERHTNYAEEHAVHSSKNSKWN
jgi:hypothetical protein